MTGGAAEGAERPARVHLLDETRGLCLLLMILYHGAYDVIYLFGVDIPAFHWRIVRLAQPFVAGIFIFISGIACRYSRSNLRRGLIALGLGLGLTLVTMLFLPGQEIWFGILHFMGTCMILFALLHKTADKLPAAFGIAVCAALFLFTVDLPRGLVGIPGLCSVALPESLYRPGPLLPLGFGGMGADYFPLLPWGFVFFAGGCFGRYFLAGRMPDAFYKPHVPFLSAVGRRSILVYLFHQPAVYGVLWLFFRIVRGA